MIVKWKKSAYLALWRAFDEASKIRRTILKEQVKHIQDELAFAPERLGESRSGNNRLWFRGVFEIAFTIESSELVSVVAMRISDKAWPDYEPPNAPL